MTKKRLIHLIISLALTALLLFTIFSEVSPAEFLAIIAKSNLSLVLVYLAISLFSQVIRAIRYRLILSSVGQENLPSTSRFLIVTFIRSAFVDFLPARLGELSFLYVLNRYGITVVRGATTFAVCLVLDIAVLLAIFLIFTLGSFLFQDQIIAGLVSDKALVVVSIILFAIFLVIYKLEKVIVFFEKFIPLKFTKVHSLFKQLVHDTTLLKKEKSFLPLIFLTFLLRLGKYSALYVLLCAVISQWGIAMSEISPVLSFVAFVAAEASASLPISGLMGFGAYEAVWSLIFSLSNVSVPSIPTLIFAIHVITQVIGYTFGFIAILAFFFDQLYRKENGNSR